jgi:uncharacterized RDD family membrane protein YckC
MSQPPDPHGAGQGAAQPPPGPPYPQQPPAHPQQRQPPPFVGQEPPTQQAPQYGQPPQYGQYGQQQPQYGQEPPTYQQPQYGQQPPQYGQQQPYGQDQQQPYAQDQQGFPQAPPVPAGYGYGQYGGEVVPQGLYRDERSGLLFPQGTQLANPGRRIGAFFLAIPLAIITLGIGYIIWGLIAWSKGTTPALQVLGMRCWRPEDNSVPGFWWMALRGVVGRILEGILSLITLLTSFILMLAREDRKTLHDLIAGTVVLHDPNKVLPR